MWTVYEKAGEEKKNEEKGEEGTKENKVPNTIQSFQILASMKKKKQ